MTQATEGPLFEPDLETLHTEMAAVSAGLGTGAKRCEGQFMQVLREQFEDLLEKGRARTKIQRL